MTAGLRAQRCDVAVVGGGVAGLSTAHFVLRARPGADVRVFERASALGGNVKTVRRDGCVIDMGPDAILTRPDAAVELCRNVGLADALVAPGADARTVFIARGRRLIPMPEGMAFGMPRSVRQLAFTPLLSWRGKFRAALDLVLPAHAHPKGISVGALVDARFGREVKDALVEPIVGGIYAGDVDRLDARYVMPQFADANGSLIRALARAPASTGSPFRAPRDGMDQLIGALVASVGSARIESDSPLGVLSRRDDLWSLTFGDGRTVTARKVVLALPPPDVAPVVDAFDATLAAAVAEIRVHSTVIIVLALDAKNLTTPEGSGFLVPRTEERSLVAATFVDRKWPDRVPSGLRVLRAAVGGTHAPGSLDDDDDTLVRRALGELREYIAIGEPRWVQVQRYPLATPQPEVGHAERVRAIRAAADRVGIALAGAAYDGPGIAGCVRGARAVADRLCAESW